MNSPNFFRTDVKVYSWQFTVYLALWQLLFKYIKYPITLNKSELRKYSMLMLYLTPIKTKKRYQKGMYNVNTGLQCIYTFICYISTFRNNRQNYWDHCYKMKFNSGVPCWSSTGSWNGSFIFHLLHLPLRHLQWSLGRSQVLLEYEHIHFG